jgi:hypothetical protein
VLGLLILAAAVALGPRTGLAQSDQAPSTPHAPLRAWHFAEGISRGDFLTFFSVPNLSDHPASIMAHYHREDGIRLVQWFGVEPRARLSLNMREIVGPRPFGASFYSNQDVVVERSSTWGPSQNAESTLGFAPHDLRAWYFAEGTTRGGVGTYFVVLNLTDRQANVTAIFSREDGSRERRGLSLAPRARYALNVSEVMSDTAFTSNFVSDQDVVVERTIVSEGSTGILGSVGYAPSNGEPGTRIWDFAEGSTRNPYQTYFVLFNPGDHRASVRFSFSLEGGSSRTYDLQLPPFGRVAFDPREIVPVTDFGTTITSDRPIVAERSYLSTGDGLYGTLGFTPQRPREDTRSWFFAEGNARGAAETYFIIANFTDEPAHVVARFYPDDGSPIEHVVKVPAQTRRTLRANDLVNGRAFAASFRADRGVLVERTIHLRGRSGFVTLGAGSSRP